MFNSLVGGIFLFAANGLFAAPPPKRVLVIHPFSSAAPPFTTHALAFERALAEKLGEPVDLDEISLDMARYPDRDMQEALVEYLQKRRAAWQPDLVVPIGSPSAIFVATYRERLFPNTPIIFTSPDRRLLPAGALEENATYVGQIFDIPRLLEDMLQIAPATKNIAVVVGATPLEQRWKEMFRTATEPLTGRINFSYLDDLTFDQMLVRVSNLPPDSFIFIVLLLRDAAGVTHNADEALERMHAIANAPINSIFEHQLGLGIVGGRHYQGELVGEEAAERAVRILRGEPATSFPPKVIDPLPPRYDWRELVRWKIDQKRLPPGSTIFFRTPSTWQQHRGWIIAGVSVFIAQALLISALVANLFRRRRAERSLNESEQRIALAAEAAHLGVWELNLATNELWVSDQWRSIFHIKPGMPVTTDDVDELIHPDDRDRRCAAMQKAIDEKSGYPIEYRALLRDQTVRWIAGRARCLLNEHGRPSRLLGVSADVTDRKQAEAEAQQRREQIELLGRVSLLGEMTASLAHELNQPLYAILNNASAGMNFIDRGKVDPIQLREILVDVLADGRRAHDIVQNVRASIKKGNRVRQRMDLNEVVRKVGHTIQLEAAARSCTVQVSLGEKLPPIEGDPTQIEQVLINLVINALDAMRDTPLDLRKVQIATESNGNGTVHIGVRDYGAGIAEGTRERLFEHFFTTKEEGLGMGLAIVRAIVEAHGGQVDVENAEGGGARFHFSLPASTETPA